jgi:hypothetical protein
MPTRAKQRTEISHCLAMCIWSVGNAPASLAAIWLLACFASQMSNFKCAVSGTERTESGNGSILQL